MSEVIKEFYERKYEHEVKQSELLEVPYTKYPINRYEACIKYFADNFQGGSIMDLGTGDGIIANGILKTNPKVDKYLATDFSKNRLNGIKKRITDPRIEVAEVDVENIEVEKLEKFDAIIMVTLVEHLIEPIQALKNIKKLLKPNGFIYIDTANVADYGGRYKLLRGRFPATATRDEGLTNFDGTNVDFFDEGHLHYFTYKSLSDLLTRYCEFNHVTKYSYPIGKFFLGKPIHSKLAQIWPELFSMLVVVAR